MTRAVKEATPRAVYEARMTPVQPSDDESPQMQTDVTHRRVTPSAAIVA